MIFNKIKHGLGPLPFSWFIPAILIEYVGFFFIAKFCKKVMPLVILMFCFNCIFALTTLALHFPSFWYTSIFALPLGMTIASVEYKLDKFANKTPYLFILTILIAVVSANYVSFFKPLYFLYNCTAAFATYLLIRLFGFPKNRFFYWLGRISLEIYLLHGIFIYFITPVHWNPFIQLLSIIFATILSAALIDNIYNRILKKNA